MPEGNIWGYVLLLVILIGINAFFAMSELAVISLSDNRIKRMAQEGNKTARVLQRMLNNPSDFLATIQVGVTLSGLLASAVAADTFAEYIVYFMRDLPIAPSVVKAVSLVAITIVLSYFTLVFGELVPKRIAMSRCERVSFTVARPLSIIYKIVKPFVVFLSWSTDSVLKIFGVKQKSEEEQVTEEEIRMMLDVGNENGAIDEEEKDMINNVFEFDDSTAQDIMTHRVDMVAVDITSKLEDIVKAAIDSGKSRIPVYDDSVDDIKGILYVKDLLRFVTTRCGDENFDIKNYMREALFVAQSAPCRNVFDELRNQKNHMAIVVDEYGGTSGLVTMEDLVESVMGDIQDEYDNETADIVEQDKNTYMIDGATSMKEVERYFDIKLDEDSDYDTIGGYIIERLGYLPQNGEHPNVMLGRLDLTVEDSDDRKIISVKAVCVHDQFESDSEYYDSFDN